MQARPPARTTGRAAPQKVRDVVGLYLNTPDHAVVLRLDEKSQVQALDRTQEALPMDLGYVEGFTHDYIRHGTTTHFAALHAVTGKVIARCAKRHRHQQCLTFLRLIHKEAPSDLDIRLVVDNYATPKRAKVRAWLARLSGFHVHFTPTYSSWINKVERWCELISQRAIKHGSCTRVSDLVPRIREFTREYNKDASPFVCIAPARSILDKIERLSTRVSDSSHWCLVSSRIADYVRGSP